MGGGLMQLVAYGAQDIYLTGNPQITFFKVVYRRHTNFAIEAIPQTFDGSANFGKRVSCTIPRNGDLVGRCYLRVKLDAAVTTSVTNPADMRRLIKNCELEIGGQRIDKQYYLWQAAWHQLTLGQGQQQRLSSMVEASDKGSGEGVNDVWYLPLDFFFCRHAGLALPLIALQYHEVKVIIELDTAANIKSNVHTSNILAGPSNVSSCELLVDYYYLDTDERRRFAQVSHEYLIEQVQHTGVESVTAAGTNNVTLNFNHPVKELIWCLDAAGNNANATNPSYFSKAKLQLNGHDRFRELDGDYFVNVQPFQHHTGVQGVMAGSVVNRARDTGSHVVKDSGYYCYSFAIKPEEHQPSGTCNFSRIDNATLQLTHVGTATDLWVFAHGYNVLRVMSGMGGLAYSN